ncbi:MAG TPA: glycoside hydrolase family 16 protein [Bacteroidia bacterium]|jgi:beta-glucanase (GH16 family)|nr:glycoside hydrolase family 16 protein [Bacteroidia bacterium]
MKKLNYIFLFLFAIVLSQTTNGQIPINDPAWQLQPTGTSGGSEEFNSALDFTNKWFPQFPWGDYNGGPEIDLQANLIQTTGTTLKIKADTLIPSVKRPNSTFNVTNDSVTIVYQGGCLQSRMLGGSDVYKFGYLEIYAKYPTSHYAYWPAFWLWSGGCSPLFYNEIDICENADPISFTGTIMGTNSHLYLSDSCPVTTNTTDQYVPITGLPLLSSAFHKYAIEWAPDRMIYYFDDVAVRTVYDPTGVLIPQHAMAVILNFAVDPYYAFLPSDWNNPGIYGTPVHHGDHSPTLYPAYFEIDYLRYYKLNADCSTNLTICTPSTDYSSRAVEKSISTGGSCSPTFNPSTTASSWTLRATDDILIDSGTTINPSGTGYVILETMACPQ